MQEINIVEFQEKESTVKEFIRKYKNILCIIIFGLIFIITFNIFNAIVVPSKSEVAELCEEHLRISRDFKNITRYDNVSSEVLDNGDTIVTVKSKFYKITARYDENNILIGQLEESFTIPFYPYILYITTLPVSFIIYLIVVFILKKKRLF